MYNSSSVTLMNLSRNSQLSFQSQNVLFISQSISLLFLNLGKLEKHTRLLQSLILAALSSLFVAYYVMQGGSANMRPDKTRSTKVIHMRPDKTRGRVILPPAPLTLILRLVISLKTISGKLLLPYVSL